MATTAANRIRGKEREELAEELRKRVTGEVRFDTVSRILYSTDASIYQMEPVGVVIPKNADDVQAVIQIAHQNGVPVLPRAGGTSLAGQTVNHAIVIDFSKYLNQVLEVNTQESWARVQPGIILDQLNKQLAPHGLQYAPDPTTANRACVGGGVGNNTCGAHSVIYGKTLDHIKELDVILADAAQTHFQPLDARELESKLSGSGLESEIYRGVRRIAQENIAEVQNRYPNIMRRVSGYNLDEFLTDDPFNLSRMVVGSEGTRDERRDGLGYIGRAKFIISHHQPDTFQPGRQLSGQRQQPGLIRIGFRSAGPIPDLTVEVHFLLRRRLTAGAALVFQLFKFLHQLVRTILGKTAMPDQHHRRLQRFHNSPYKKFYCPSY